MGNGRIDGWQCIIGKAIIHRSQNYLVDVWTVIVIESYSMAMGRDHRPRGRLRNLGLSGWDENAFNCYKVAHGF
jgi:hypothetical protein